MTERELRMKDVFLRILITYAKKARAINSDGKFDVGCAGFCPAFFVPATMFDMISERFLLLDAESRFEQFSSTFGNPGRIWPLYVEKLSWGELYDARRA